MSPKPPPFTHLGRYRVVRELGRGAMGVVYLAEDESLQRQVAVKTLLLPDDSAERMNLEARFLQEAKAAGGLNHPGIITIHDLGREGDWLYIAMELLQGTELRDRMTPGQMPLDEALDIAGQVASALAVAHARGVVHRDIKPGNIMLLAGGQTKIMDFGIARMKTSNVRTQSGTMMGSPKYMSPEQVGGHPVDHRSDIFSLGTMLHEMLTGEPAFVGNTLGELLNAILHGSSTPVSNYRPDIPPELELVLARATQKNPQSRYQDAAEMARDLAQIRGVASPARANGGSEGPADPYAATLVGGVAVGGLAPQAPEGLTLSPRFDSTAGLQRLVQGGAQATRAGGARGRSWRGLGWPLAYLTATVAAFAIAFG
jgi:serine/threonine-protein kinase